jgi:hypothetical protein
MTPEQLLAAADEAARTDADAARMVELAGLIKAETAAVLRRLRERAGLPVVAAGAENTAGNDG